MITRKSYSNVKYKKSKVKYPKNRFFEKLTLEILTCQCPLSDKYSSECAYVS